MKISSKEIRLSLDVRSVDRLLNLADTPLTQPGLHPEAAHVLRVQASGFPKCTRFQVDVVVPAEDIGRQQEVQTAVRTQFHEEYIEARKELRAIYQKGWWSFLKALAVVAVLITLSEGMLTFRNGRLFTALSKSLIIVAWVVLWAPAETLIFAPFSVRRKRERAKALAWADVELHTK